MKDEIIEEYSEELSEEMQRFSKEYPVLSQLFVEVMQAVTSHETALNALNEYSAHLEAGRQDHDWKLSVLKDLAVQSLKRIDPNFELNLPGFDALKKSIH